MNWIDTTWVSGFVALCAFYVWRRYSVTVMREDEADRRRRALAGTGKPMPEKWRLENGYDRTGRDHR